mmetsp:Transcript_71983/g.166674  ORF Transcript_71983/g.166674 Transcript_71983/m.166674 type:complete len:423 (-) Transcript_71983:113-1381(-)
MGAAQGSSSWSWQGSDARARASARQTKRSFSRGPSHSRGVGRRGVAAVFLVLVISIVHFTKSDAPRRSGNELLKQRLTCGFAFTLPAGRMAARGFQQESVALRGARGAGRQRETTSPVACRAWESFAEFAEDPVVSVVGWSVVFASLTILKVAISEEQDTPRAFLDAKTSGWLADAPMSAPIVCLGDSLTRGNLSFDWVANLRERLTDSKDPGMVINAGVNMQCVQNVRNRLDEVIACRPSHVTVLVGTNDLKAMHSGLEAWMYMVFGKLPKVPTLEDYERDLVEIRDRLVESGACVALVSPPVLGEDLASPANKAAAAFAATVKRVAKEGGEQCTYLPLFEQTRAKLPAVGGRPYDGLKFFWWVCLLCFDIHLLKRDLAEVQRERRLGVTLDLVHLGPAAASSLADMTAAFVTAFPVRVPA